MGRRLRRLFNEAGFDSLALKRSLTTSATGRQTGQWFAHDRAMECRDEEWRTTVTRHGIASAEELTHLAADWKNGLKIPGRSSPSPGAECWRGRNELRYLG
jgi:hypothetical protein